MKERQQKILNAIVKEFQQTGQPVSSAMLAERYEFDFSPATVRAEMLNLDQAGYLQQPHTSAGRIPTDKALRFFIDEFGEDNLSHSEKEKIWQQMEQLHRESISEMAQFLAECTRSFGISASFGRAADFHGAGFRWLAEEPEFEDDNFIDILKKFDSMEEDFDRFFHDLDEGVEVFIGQENPIKYLRHCSLMLTAFENGEGKKILGVLGPKRMNYRKNKFVLEEARKRVKIVKNK